jgi:predicted RNase H-related nuclease YkuK (DUF458 family)
MKTRWKTLTDAPVDDILQFVSDAAARGQTVHVGTDSLQTGRFTQFVTVVVIHTPSKGGRAAYTREILPRIQSLRERLMQETWRSIELGMELTGAAPGGLEIHLDVNPEKQHKSSQYVQELVGWVMGQGFKAVIKPDAWAASHAADHVVRFKGKLPSVA